MPRRLKVSGFDDVRTQRVAWFGQSAPGVQYRLAVYVGNVLVGHLVHFRRLRPDGGSEYGYKPETADSRATLADKSEAVARLLVMDGPRQKAAVARAEAARKRKR